MSVVSGSPGTEDFGLLMIIWVNIWLNGDIYIYIIYIHIYIYTYIYIYIHISGQMIGDISVIITYDW